ncbi:hypothetical protein [Phycicoccus sp.]|uniref:hypothetical protein n=1 Tax=Phycicoccus sp. TaxID=1902410 RepID=UPI002D0DA198|nr:hypothetical protein [Phycicoccus sp.]HMM95305.1 hypothetical protein [Phycicoccus sp.]
MAVRAKFYVAQSTRYAHGTSRPGYADPAPFGEVILRPVTRGEDNKEWASSTPSGEIKMTVNGPALPWFEQRLGAEVAITFDDVAE